MLGRASGLMIENDNGKRNEATQRSGRDGLVELKKKRAEASFPFVLGWANLFQRNCLVKTLSSKQI